jgi:hypothetical protein
VPQGAVARRRHRARDGCSSRFAPGAKSIRFIGFIGFIGFAIPVSQS